MLIFPREMETHIYAQEGVIYLEQFDEYKNRTSVIRLSIHQFQEIFNREKSIIAKAREDQEDAQ